MVIYNVDFDDKPKSEDIQAVRDGLSAFNVQHVPTLRDLPDDEIAIFVRDERGTIQGGIVGEMDWGMMYVDLLWLKDDLRGKQLGKALLHTMEQETLQLGVPHIYLMTTEFQALPFYQHMGYELFGTIMNRPHGYAYYYLRKLNIPTCDVSYDVTVTHMPTKDDVRVVNRGLRNYCEQFVDCTSQPLTGFIRRDNGQMMGGIVGSTYWDWYDLRFLWVHDDLRNQGYGKHLLHLAEVECRQRGMTGIVCDTADFQALGFYQKQGFEVFATMPDRPPGHQSYFLQKLLK